MIQSGALAIPPTPWPLSRRATKRAFDVALSLLTLPVLALPLLAIGIAVWTTSTGPALFRQERLGRGGRRFRVWKFRTMADRSEQQGSAVTAAGDPRITPLGRLLRASKLDELPQLWNVLRGDMSFVGPRPEVPRYLPHYRPEDQIVLAIRPGITDPASIAYRNEEQVLAAYSDRERGYVEELLPRKLELARWYIDQQSLSYDLRLLFRTAIAIVWVR